MTNGKPISLLSIQSKVLERCVFDNVYPFLHELINNAQHAFLRNATQYWQNLDQNKQVDMLYLDFSIAFDSVDHDILLYNINLHGINGSLLGWFESSHTTCTGIN